MNVYSRWLVYFPLELGVKALAMLLTPLVAIFVTKEWRTDRVKRRGNVQVTMQREYLISWLRYFQTHDNAVDEYWWGLFSESSYLPLVRLATQEQYDASAFLRYLCRVLWMWRNPAYGFSYHWFGRALDAVVTVEEVGDKAQGLWVRRTKRGSSFQYQAHRPVGKFYLDINIGWKEHDGFPRVMYAGRVISIRRTKGI